MYIILVILAIAIVFYLLWHHQHKLKLRAYLMSESIRNRDFSFRLSSKGLLPGERAMQESLYDMGQEVRQLVNQNEVESWEKLTRVLTHEIMNSAAPIASIANSMLQRQDVVGTPLEEGIRAIHSTAARLNSFVENYRKMSEGHTAVPEDIELSSFVKDLTALFPELNWSIQVPEVCKVRTDASMLHQVLVNMIKNAVEADAKRMELRVEKAESAPRLQMRPGETGTPNHVNIIVSNDGQPIPPHVRSSMFVPFFTTKVTGRGIGLSLSRQFIVKQGGTLELMDTPIPSYVSSFRVGL